MKFKLRKNRLNNIIIIFVLIGSVILTISSSFYMKKTSFKETTIEYPINKSKRSENISKYVKDNESTLIEEKDFQKDIVEVVLEKEERYETKIFSYETGEEMSIEDILKADCIDTFKAKVNELLDLKYPKFIADVLKSGEGKKVYYLKDFELMIYYYDYDIEPQVSEELYLKVNYNEIKDLLAIEVNYNDSYENEDGRKINKDKKLIALTFDDGPGQYTDNLLDILKNNKANATFFMLGKNLSHYSDTVLKAHNLGMEIGYHSYAHTNFKRQEIAEIKSELEFSNEILKNITGDTFHLIRPPYGSINEEIKEALDAPLIFWHIDTEDWRHHDIEYLKKYTLDNLEDGDIILFHDIHKTSVLAIEEILPYLYVNGFQVLSVSELAETFGYNLESNKKYFNFIRKENN